MFCVIWLQTARLMRLLLRRFSMGNIIWNLYGEKLFIVNKSFVGRTSVDGVSALDEIAKRWTSREGSKSHKSLCFSGLHSGGFRSVVVVDPRKPPRHHCYEKQASTWYFCVIHKFHQENVFKCLANLFLPDAPSKSKTIFLLSSLACATPKLIVLMMVIPGQYRSVNVVKHIVGKQRERESREKMEK